MDMAELKDELFEIHGLIVGVADTVDCSDMEGLKEDGEPFTITRDEADNTREACNRLAKLRRELA